MISEKLEKLGLSSTEAKAYIASLELGEASIQLIADKSGLNRITTHVTIEKLAEQGLIKETRRGKRRMIVAEMPEKLINNLVDKKTELERQVNALNTLLPELKSIYNYSETKPRIRFFEGLDGLKIVYNDTLTGSHKKIQAFTAYQAADKNLAKWLNSYYIPKRIKKGIVTQVLAPSSIFAKDKKSSDKEEKRETRLLSAIDYPFTIEVNIYGDKVAIISFRSRELLGVIIESNEVAKTFSLIFKLAWQAVKN
jgi:sugar-specific transcriptional regulator TrmB